MQLPVIAIVVACGLTAACPSSPEFVASTDVPDTTTTDTTTDTTTTDATDATEPTAPDATTDATTDAPDTTTTDAPDTATDADTDDTRVAPSCPPPCGPGAACEVGRCACVSASCTTTVVTQASDELVIVMPAPNTPVIAFTRFIARPDVNLTRWGGMAWTTENDLFFANDVIALGATVVRDGAVVLLGEDELQTPAFHWDTGDVAGWQVTSTGFGACMHAGITFDATTDRVIIGCVEPSTATLSFAVLEAPGAGVLAYSPWTLGKSPNSNTTRWVVDATGVVWVVYTENKSPDATVHVARYDGDWTKADLGAVRPLPDAAAGPAIDIAADGLGRPHVVYARTLSEQAVLTHRVRTGTAAWASYEIPIAVPLDGIDAFDLEPGDGGEVQLLIGRQRVLTWLRFDDGDLLQERSVTLAEPIVDADMLTDERAMPWVAYGEGRVSVGLWRPAGP